MTLNERLEELKLPKEKLEGIYEALRAEYVAKAEYERLSDNLSALRGEHKKKTEFLKQSALDKLERQKAEFERQIRGQLIEIALTEAKAKNNEIVKSLLDNEKVQLRDNKLTGLEPQICKLKKNAPFLFEDSLVYLTGYRPEPSSDILPKAGSGDMTYSETVAYLERISE